MKLRTPTFILFILWLVSACTSGRVDGPAGAFDAPNTALPISDIVEKLPAEGLEMAGVNLLSSGDYMSPCFGVNRTFYRVDASRREVIATTVSYLDFGCSDSEVWQVNRSVLDVVAMPTAHPSEVEWILTPRKNYRAYFAVSASYAEMEMNRCGVFDYDLGEFAEVSTAACGFNTAQMHFVVEMASGGSILSLALRYGNPIDFVKVEAIFLPAYLGL